MSRSEAAQGSANSPVLTAARAYARAGISVVPIRVDGSKQPAVVWKSYQSTYPLADEVDDWFDNGQYGIGLVCGHISGGLEVLDCEDPTAFDQWRALVEARAPGLIARLPVVATPRPGRHVYYRSASVEGNQKLARGADGRTLIETRGEGGYVIAPGSAAACHPTGRTYEHVGGPPLTEIPLITAEERAALLAIARSFDHREIDSCKDDQLGATAQEWPAAAPGSTEPLPNVLNRATGYLRACDPAISGQGGHNQTFKVTCRLLHGFHLDDEMAFSLLLNHYNPRCVPPWSERELRHKVESARTQGSYHDMLNHPHFSGGPSTKSQIALNGDDSSPKAPQKEGTIWRPVPISQLKRVALPDTWVWEGLLAPGKVTLLSAEAKAGKTTLLSLLYRRMASGGRLCGTDVYPGRAIVVSEEPKDIWIERREHLGLGDHLEVVSMPFATKPTQRDWETMIGEAVQALKEQPADLVVLDTLSHLWWLWDENDNAKEAAALMPLRQLSNAGAALALVHHFGAEGKGPRGGTELRAFPDLIVDLHLHKPNDFVDRRRVLKVRGRLLEPNQLVIQLNEDGDDYLVAEGALATGAGTLWAVLSQLVPSQPPGLPATGFRRAWPTQPPPKAKSLNVVLAERSERAGWVRTGAGKKNDPYCYWRPDPTAN